MWYAAGRSLTRARARTHTHTHTHPRVSSPVVFRLFNEYGDVIAPRADPSRDNYCAQRNETFLPTARPGSVKMHVQVT